jgi:hypothetical protein
LADSTPGVFFRKRSIRLTQLAHVMPSTGRWISAGALSVRAAVSLILPGSIAAGTMDEYR